jgi:hypothetical protein
LVGLFLNLQESLRHCRNIELGVKSARHHRRAPEPNNT